MLNDLIAQPPVHGWLELRRLRFFAHLGATEAEREVGAWVRVTVRVQSDWTELATSDRLSDAIDYRALYDVIERAATSARHVLVEHLACSILDARKLDARVTAASVRLTKDGVPDVRPIGAVRAEVEWSRAGGSPS